MAPSYKCAAMISLLLIVFSTAAPNPSAAAIRSSSAEQPEAAAAGKSKSSSHVVVAPAPAPRGTRRSTQLQFFWTPDFPCFPFLPKILLDICHALFPPPPPPSPPRAPVVCRPSLTKTFVPACGGFLTNASVSAPSSDCCGKIHSFYDDPTTSAYCLCHVANGEADRMLPAPVANQTRRVDVFVACLNLSADIISRICDKDGRTYRELVPPMDPPSPSPPAPGKKA